MNGKKCTLLVNTSYGYVFSPIQCNSITEAVKKGKESGGFAFRIFDETTGKLIKKGYCD